ncbi:uroporphyrinogen-III synthase [Candidatus Rhabdochlamydia sp. T3358]|uniref:uroporphyrinogen-III synthase n=1 Tax=Candidatus Rhabdochlamydia sp. T3358 TaxID=2099795 RepID=UPI0010B6B789|nr:uroporphyrinogen-III synthase [Candidatus Rhabdochlamydia sp. T3358]VHO04112.1 uroporphyrinogen-III synthase [Candidatus Rhabdochlamydia sp. T3358]
MRKALYLGTDPSYYQAKGAQIIHYPVIQIIPRMDSYIQAAYSKLANYTHLLFTSKNTVQVFFQQLNDLDISKNLLEPITIIAIGQVTASYVKKYTHCSFVVEEETQEGMVAFLRTQSLEKTYFFSPRSSLSRNVILDFFQKNHILFQDCFIYDTVVQKNQPIPHLEDIDEIIFTSPSTIKAFLEIFSAIPLDKKLTTIGPITQKALSEIKALLFPKV